MSRRFVCRVLLGVLSVLPAAGCLTTSPHGTPPLPPESAERPKDAKAELPPQAAAKVHLKLAEDFDRNGREAEAVVFYEKARAADPQLQKRVGRRLALLYDRLDDAPHALPEYQKALKANPRDADLLNSFGYFYYTRGKWAEAEEQLRAALVVNPKHAWAWNHLGLTLAQQNRYTESLAAFEHVVSKAEAHSNLAFVLTTQGKRDEARRAYHQALALNPELTIAQRALAEPKRRRIHPLRPRWRRPLKRQIYDG